MPPENQCRFIIEIFHKKSFSSVFLVSRFFSLFRVTRANVKHRNHGTFLVTLEEAGWKKGD
jgi:hypothetical protein